MEKCLSVLKKKKVAIPEEKKREIVYKIRDKHCMIQNGKNYKLSCCL